MGTVFTPIFLFIGIAILTAVGMIVTSEFLGPRKRTAVKQMPYESGMDPIGDARQRFDVRYYLIAIVFLLFDVELLFLYPWAVSQYSAEVVVASSGPPLADAPALPGPVGLSHDFRGLVFGEILVFILVLTAAFAYAWKKGVFEWR
jgi:NADH-quinone oxidoreductase subunit A